MSPFHFNGSTARVFIVTSNGNIGDNLVYRTNGVRPVINLKADTHFTGEGTIDSPFTVV